jgi:hypothetical protein
MPTQEIDLTGFDLKSISPKLSAMSHINCHYIIDPSLEKNKVLVRFPGSDRFSHVGDELVRGFYGASNSEGLYVVQGLNVLALTRSGSVKKIGQIGTTVGHVSMADSGRQLMIVDGREGYIVDITVPVDEQTVVKITDADYPKTCTSVIFQMGRFLVNVVGENKFYGSAIFDGFSWDGLDFASAEAYPDNIIRLANGPSGIIYLFGNQSIEIWVNDGSANFPYSRVSGGVIQTGLMSYESLCNVEDSVIFLGRSASSGKKIFKLSGQSVTDITTAEMTDIIEKLKFHAESTALTFNSNGNPIYQIAFNEIGREFFVDLKTGLWGERKSRNKIGHVWKYGTSFESTQFFCSKFDAEIFIINRSHTKDGSFYQDFQFTGRHLSQNEEYFSVNSLQFVVEMGQGTDDDYNKAPKAVLSYSKDGGFSFTPEIQGSMGKLGDYLKRLIWRRLGTANDIVFRLKVTDQVAVKVISAIIDLRG